MFLMTSSHMPGYETHARHSPSRTFRYASEGTQSQPCYFKSTSASMHTIQEVSTNASIHTSLQTVLMLQLPSCAKEGLGGKLGIFALLLPKNCSLGVCVLHRRNCFSIDCCYCLDSSSIDESKIHIHSFPILLYQSG